MHALTYKSVDTSAPAYGLNVTRAEIPLFAAARIDVQERSVRDGAIVQAATLSAMRIPVEATIGRDDDDRNAFDAQLRAVAKLFDPRLGAGWLQVRGRATLDDAPRQYWAIVEGEPLISRYSDHFAEVRLSFLVPDGKATSLVADTQQDTIDADPKTFFVPTSAAEVVGGNSTAYPVWIFENTDATALSSLELENITTGKKMSWGTVSPGNLNQNDLLRIDTLLERVEKSVDAGANWTNELHHLTLGSPLPLLADGVRNEFEITGVVAGTLDVSYNREYLS